jgi:hypothetical protein
VQVLGNQQIVPCRTLQNSVPCRTLVTNQLCNALVLYEEVLKIVAKYFFGKQNCGTFTLLAAHPVIVQPEANKMKTN